MIINNKIFLSLRSGLLALVFLQSGVAFSQGKIIVKGATIKVKNSAFVVTKDISLTNLSSVSVDSSTLKVAGSISSNNNIDVQQGTLEMYGATPQTIPANSFTANKIKYLTISNNVTLAGEDSLTGVLSFGAVNSKIFSTGGFLTLKSTAAATASVADLTNDNTNSGNQVLGDVTAERYIPAIKKWFFLSIPTNTLQSVKAAWQEGCDSNKNCFANYGTQITGVGGLAAGFDQYTSTPSMKSYSTAADAWIGIPNTHTAQINNVVNNTVAYMVLVRGDRTATTLASPVTPTILRTKGVIKQSTQSPVTIASPATAFTSVGNPYPSRIDLRKMTPAPTLSTKIYIWDPYATIGSAYGLGAYQTLTFDGSDFTVTPGGGSYPAQNPNYIESGQAFFVGGNSAPYTITFKEDIKPSVNKLLSTPIGMKQNIKVDLYAGISGKYILMDGAKADIGNNFSAGIDDNDALKISNSAENVALRRNGKLLSVERYSPIISNDTFYLNIKNMKVQSYQWKMNLNNLALGGMTAFLLDKYKQSQTALTLNSTTIVDFTVENVAGSYAQDRFSIVFTPAAVLPLTFTNVRANGKKSAINVEWDVANETNIQQYEIDKSVDGTNYENVHTTTAKNLPQSLYEWIDEQAATGFNYYRIKSVDVNGKIEYSKVVKVFMSVPGKGISVYPNPILGGVVRIQFKNQSSGIYGVRMFNKLGQAVVSKQITHAAGGSVELIQFDKKLSSGIYQLEITKPGGEQVNINVIY